MPGLRGNPVLLPHDFLVVPACLLGGAEKSNNLPSVGGTTPPASIEQDQRRRTRFVLDHYQSQNEHEKEAAVRHTTEDEEEGPVRAVPVVLAQQPSFAPRREEPLLKEETKESFEADGDGGRRDDDDPRTGRRRRPFSKNMSSRCASSSEKPRSSEKGDFTNEDDEDRDRDGGVVASPSGGSSCATPRRRHRRRRSRRPVSPSRLPLSTEERVLAVRAGAPFRAKLRKQASSLAGARSQGLGVTVKASSRGKIVVHALPRTEPEARGRAESAGVKVGDVVLGVGDSYFGPDATLRTLVEQIKAAEADGRDVVLLLRRGAFGPSTTLPLQRRSRSKPASPTGSCQSTPTVSRRHVIQSGVSASATTTWQQNNKRRHREREVEPSRQRVVPLAKMAQLLREQRVLDDAQAAILSSMMAQLERRLERWDRRTDLLAGSAAALATNRTISGSGSCGGASSSDGLSSSSAGRQVFTKAEEHTDHQPYGVDDDDDDDDEDYELEDESDEEDLHQEEEEDLLCEDEDLCCEEEEDHLCEDTDAAGDADEGFVVDDDDDDEAAPMIRGRAKSTSDLLVVGFSRPATGTTMTTGTTTTGTVARRRRRARDGVRSSNASHTRDTADRRRRRPFDDHKQGGITDGDITPKNGADERAPIPPPPKRPLLRPALCVRVLGTDYVEDHTVYVVWVLDVLAGAEWKVRRRFREFYELREELVKLRPSLEKLDFPVRRPAVLYETVHSVNERRVKLEKYVRRAVNLLYSSRLHARSGDVARALQNFLDVPKRRASLELLERNPDVSLRQACQVATAQVLGLPVFEKILSDIVSSARAHKFDSGLEMLDKMKQYIDHLQSSLLDGAADLLRAALLRRAPAHAVPEDDLRATLSAAARRQIETDVFVPLMDKLHSLLSHDTDDDEQKLRDKCQRAKSRPQTYFGIPLHHISPSSWESAIYQLANIGSYTLPCDKLDALLAAAKEIPALYLVEHPGTDKHLGADDFLPIFIYVLVNADVPNLVYLQKVLCCLCDPDKRLSETGYYVATFEAAVCHIMEMDLD